MTFKRSLLLVLLLAALLSADDSFAEKDKKVVFVGKSTSASARLALKGKTLSMNFKAIGGNEDKLIGMTLDLGGCVVEASFLSSYGEPYLRFKDDEEDRNLGFPVIAELSQNGVKAHMAKNKSRNYQQPCEPKFKTEGDLHLFDVSVTLKTPADSLAIEFNDAKLSSKQDEMSTGSIVLIAAGSVGSVILLAGGIVGVIVYCIRHKRNKGKKEQVAKVSTKDDKKVPIAIKPSHIAIQIDLPAPKPKSPPAKKERSKPASQEQAPKRSENRQKTATSEDTAEPAPSKPSKPKSTLSQEYFGPGQLITPTQAKSMSAEEDKPDLVDTFNSEEAPIEPTAEDYRKKGPSILPRALVHTEYLPESEFPLLNKLLRQETYERRYELFFLRNLEGLKAEISRAKSIVERLFHARPGEMDFYWLGDLYANLGDLSPLVEHVDNWKQSDRQGCDLPWAFTLIAELASLHRRQLMEGDRKVPLTLRQRGNVRKGMEWLKGKKKKAEAKGDEKEAKKIAAQVWRLEYLIGTVEERATLEDEGAVLGLLE